MVVPITLSVISPRGQNQKLYNDGKMIEETWQKLIKKTVAKYLPTDRYKVFLFGSRATGVSRKWSDVDVGILGSGKVDLTTLTRIKGELADSDIPYRTEVVDFSSVSGNFRRLAMGKVIYL